jgi:hypothetical protein
MKLEDTRIGTKVRVDLDYTKADLQGLVGTVRKHYGAPNYTAFEVLFPDGQRQLFWDHQLEETIEEPPSLPKRWWVFW